MAASRNPGRGAAEGGSSGSVHCAMYREPFSAGVTRVPGAFLLARPGRLRGNGCVPETALVAGRISFSIHYAEGARRKRNGHPFLRVQGVQGRRRRIDKYLGLAACPLHSSLHPHLQLAS